MASNRTTMSLVSFLALMLWTFLGLVSVSLHYFVEALAADLPPQIGAHGVIKSSPRLASGAQPLQDRPQETNEPSVFLFSLQWTPDDRISREVRSLWKWKDSTLGDGRDFFVPKPKTLKSLQNYLLKHCTGLQECSVLSNCARLEVLCIVAKSATSSTHASTRNNNADLKNSTAAVNSTLERRLLEEVSLCFASQMLYASSSTRSVWSQLFFPTQMDRPNAVLNLDHSPLDVDGGNDPYRINVIQDVRDDLSEHWKVIRGPHDVLQHLCEVAAGMAARPRRPDRTTLFRPFSSRDAHILLQLKRTKEIVSVARYAVGGPHYESVATAKADGVRLDRRQKIISLLFEYALRAGKAARNPKIVPELNLLRGDISVGGPTPSIFYPSSPRSSLERDGTVVASGETKSIRYGVSSTMTELEKSRRVATVARSKAIDPLVRECMGKFDIDTDGRREVIADLRARALHLVLTSGLGDTRHVDVSLIRDIGDDAAVHRNEESELRWLKRKLHQPTMELRNEGQLVSYANADALLDDIRDELKDFRLRFIE